MPEFAKVCEDVEGGLTSLTETCQRLPAECDLLAHESLLRFEIADAFFLGFDEGRAVHFDDAVEQLFDFSRDGANVFALDYAIQAVTTAALADGRAVTGQKAPTQCQI